MFKRGDKCYILESNMTVREAKVCSKQGNMYTIQLVGSCGAIRLKESRLFESEEAALNSKRGYEQPEIEEAKAKVEYIDPFEGRRINRSPHTWESGR